MLRLWRRPAPAAPDGDYDAEEGLTFETSKGIRVVTSFDDMRLKDLLMRGIYQFGFEKPSAIQQRAIIPISEGRDVIAQAQSGTGKTSMIAVAMCQRVDTSMRECVTQQAPSTGPAPCLQLACLQTSHCLLFISYLREPHFALRLYDLSFVEHPVSLLAGCRRSSCRPRGSWPRKRRRPSWPWATLQRSARTRASAAPASVRTLPATL